MKIYDELPDKVEYKGRIYNLNLNWRNVLKSIDLFDQEEISEAIKVRVALDNLVIGKHPVDADLLDAIFRLIFPPKKDDGEPVIDFEQDSALIFAAFWQTYHINLRETNLHWRDFTELLKGIPRSTRLGEIIELRQAEIPEPTKYNAKERAKLIQAKAKVAIKSKANKEKAFMNIYKMLEAQAKAGD